ncbi:unnamed protein product, partial [Mesorhabditis spiculigera]
MNRSASSTPSVPAESDGDRATPSAVDRERAQMLNVPVGDDLTSTQTPPPTVEVATLATEPIVRDRETSKEVEIGVLYRWKEWRLVRDNDSLYIWADMLAIEFPKRFRLKLELAGADTEAQKHLLNRTNRSFKSEPLTSVGQLKNFLLRMVAKQWYDRERDSYNFVKQIKEQKEITCTYSSDFDDQGIMFWLGTNGKVAEWINPASIGVVKVTCSDTPKQPFGRPEDVLSRDVNPINCHSSDDKNSNFTIDTGLENLLEKSRILIDRTIVERNETAEGRETPEDQHGPSTSQPTLNTNQSATGSSDAATASAAVPEGVEALSLSTPDLASARERAQSTEAASDVTQEDQDTEGDVEEDEENDEEEPEDDDMEDEDEEEDTEPDNDDRGEKRDEDVSFSQLLAELEGEGKVGQAALAVPAGSSTANTNATISQERGIIERLRDVIGMEDSIEQLISGLGPPSTQAIHVKPAGSRKVGTSVSKSIKGYADVIKSMMQQMMDPTSAMDVEDMEEDIFDDEANEEDLMDDELPYNILPDSLAQALIPAFDPRPGRTNINQTQEVELPATISEPTAASNAQPKNTSEAKIRLFLRGPNMPGIENITFEMDNDDHSLFKCIQKLTNNVEWQQKGDRNRRIFDPVYTLIYEDASAATNIDALALPSEDSKVPDIVNQTLDALNLLAKVGATLPESELPSNVFISDKLSQKLLQELSDPLVVAARSMPDWCERLVYSHPCLFTMDTRNMYMGATAFGVARSIVWIQSRRDAALERSRGTGAGTPNPSSAVRREDAYEYRVGRLKHERIKVTRAEDELLEQAIRLFRFHCSNKAVLEIEYNGEEGTGLGPTLEFYALISAEMQRKALAIWWCDDLDETQLKLEEKELDLGEGKKPPGFYVRRAGGLFPAPLPPNTEQRRRANELFRVLGIFMAKVLQDGRLVDIPLSPSFLKLVIHPKVSTRATIADLDGVLTLDDFELVHPIKGRFLKELSSLAARKRALESDDTIDTIAKRRRYDELMLNIGGARCKIDDLGLNFTVNPPSAVFQYKEMELIEGGADMDVTMENVELYVEKCSDYYLNSGIVEQVRAFREGFDRVFPLRSLRSFTPEEVQCLISGEQSPVWNRDDILNYTEPKLGYTRDSPGFLKFVDVMDGLTPAERKNFLQFATGCSSLPPGGLANLHPRLTVVRKVESGDGSYPSVNTCVHYLKLPDYSTAEILRERLLTAINEKGFHLN